MGTSWRTLARSVDAEFEGDDVVVRFPNRRSQRVTVREVEDAYEFHSVVARAGAVRDIVDLPIRIWQHNRASQLVSFRIDTRGRVCAAGWVPKVGLTADEFQLVLRRVAAQSDRLEFLLTGRDAEAAGHADSDA